VAARPQ